MYAYLHQAGMDSDEVGHRGTEKVKQTYGYHTKFDITKAKHC